MRKRLFTAAALTAVGALVLTGCANSGSESGESGAGGGDTVAVGASLPLTGPLQSFGTSLKLGYERAVEEINAGGGLDVGGEKRQVEVLIQDNGSDGAAASQQSRDLVLDDGAVALLGAAAPDLNVPISLAAEQLQVPASLTTTPIQAWLGANPSGYQFAWNFFFDELQMTETQFLASDLIDTNKKVALFTDQAEDGVVMGNLWEQSAPKLGYEIVSRAQFPVGNTDFSAQVSEAKTLGAEVVIAQVIPPDGIALLREMKTQSYAPKAVFIEKAGDTGNFPMITDGLGEGTMAASWFAEGIGYPGDAEFAEAYREAVGGLNADLGTVMYGYTAAKILFEAISRAGSTDGAAINAEMANTDGEYPIGSVSFGEDHSFALPAVQTQWVGADMVMVLDQSGAAAAPITSPPAGLAP